MSVHDSKGIKPFDHSNSLLAEYETIDQKTSPNNEAHEETVHVEKNKTTV